MSTVADLTDQRPSRFLEMGVLAKLSRLRFATRRRIEGSYSGRHLSRQRGGSAEFADYREYVPGEDIRRIDWKVLGRTGRPYVRLYQDETSLRCTMMIDASGSMMFRGTNPAAISKLQYVQYLATAFSHLIAEQREQVGLAIAADGLAELYRPGGTRTHVHRMQKTIESITTQPATNLTLAFRQTFDQLSSRGVLMVMSDFLVADLDELYSMLRLFEHRRWEVILLHIVHPEEERLPAGRAYRFEGMENDGMVECTPTQVRVEYERGFASHLAAVRGIALSAGCDYRGISTSQHYVRTVMDFLVERER